MNEISIFSDGSVRPQTQQGYGAYLITAQLDQPLPELARNIQLCTVAQTSSTRLELQTLLQALSKTRSAQQVTIYTDSQNIIGLPARRHRLQALAFSSKAGRPLANADLYRAFFVLWDQRSCHLVKVKGHSRAAEKTAVERIFTLVDQAARQACRGAR